MAGIKQIGNRSKPQLTNSKKKKQVRKARAKNQDRWFLNHLEKNLKKCPIKITFFVYQYQA